MPREHVADSSLLAPHSSILLNRQALHAARLSLAHPTTGAAMQFAAPLPDDMQTTLEALRRWRGP